MMRARCSRIVIRSGSWPTCRKKPAPNELPYGLAAYAFTRSARNADRLAQGIEAGNLSINHFVASIAETPFGGVKDSGYGREGGTEGLACYTVVKNVSHLMM
jgi:succinate-semialdehyde dehydrogenase / glutarate-semialdehyde dehydrogenase